MGNRKLYTHCTHCINLVARISHNTDLLHLYPPSFIPLSFSFNLHNPLLPAIFHTLFNSLHDVKKKCNETTKSKNLTYIILLLTTFDVHLGKKDAWNKSFRQIFFDDYSMESGDRVDDRELKDIKATVRINEGGYSSAASYMPAIAQTIWRRSIL